MASDFRRAIEVERDAGEFQSDISFNQFPRACCGDASELLAEYLRRHGIKTIWTSMERVDCHAWLTVKDWRLNTTDTQIFSADNLALHLNP